VNVVRGFGARVARREPAAAARHRRDTATLWRAAQALTSQMRVTPAAASGGQSASGAEQSIGTTQRVTPADLFPDPIPFRVDQPAGGNRANEREARLRPMPSACDDARLARSCEHLSGILAEARIGLAIVEHLPQTRVDGACIWTE
jgi:hypothetical protein